MPAIRLDTFLGELPGLHPHKLSEAHAQTAKNCKLWSGAIDALEGFSPVQAVTTVGDPGTIFKYSDSVWLEWPDEIDVVRSPVANDPYDRVFYTGDSYPRVADSTRITSGAAPYPSASLRLGVPAPDSAPSVTLGGTPDDPNDEPETRYYVVTYVNRYGEEGPPSNPSNQIEVKPGETVSVGIPAAPTGNYDVVSVNIYRSNTAAGVNQFQFVAGVNVGSGTYVDSLDSSALGEVLPSEEWDPPPDDMEGIVAMPGGFLAGFRKNQVMFSEPGLPHAWPVRYWLTLDYDVVGLGVFGNTLVICTTGVPYLANGAHPGGMALTRTRIEQACVSKRGIVSVAGGVVYPSPDGLVFIGIDGATLVTEGVFTRDEWRALTPSSIRAALWERLYVAFHTGGAFVFNPAQPDAGLVRLDELTVAGMYTDLEDDALYVASNGSIQQWAAGADLTYTWKSRPFRPPKPTPMRVIQVAADAYPVVARIYADGELQDELSMSDDRPQRVDNSWKARVYEVEVQGTKRVYEVILGSTMEDLRRL